MKTKTQSFASVMLAFQYRYDLRTVFDDFLTMSMCAVSQNPQTGKSYYEDLYLQTIDPYKEDKLRFEFPNLFALLINEMDDRTKSDSGNDILGEFYEQNLCKKGTQQFFTPWPICSFMARCTIEESRKIEAKRPLRILEPSCGSGRMLLAASQIAGHSQEFYGIDIDHTCVKMAALNLFLNGMFHSEVMCADALIPEDFRISYRMSFLPLGIFKIEKKENSPLWHLLKNSLNASKASIQTSENDVKLPSELRGEQQIIPDGPQLTLF